MKVCLLYGARFQSLYVNVQPHWRNMSHIREYLLIHRFLHTRVYSLICVQAREANISRRKEDIITSINAHSTVRA